MGLKLHELAADPGAKQKTRRVGRGNGSGWGRTAGSGEKGAQARAGTTKGGPFEGGQTPLIRRVPKFGFSNSNFRAHRAEITLERLDKFDAGEEITLESLKKLRLIPKKTERVKVIATGKLETKLTVRLQGYSKAARAAIEAAGGTCEVVI